MFIPLIYVAGKSSIEMLTIFFYMRIKKQEHEEFYTTQWTFIISCKGNPVTKLLNQGGKNCVYKVNTQKRSATESLNF